MVDIDSMTERLRKRDRLIVDLKEALLDREKRINNLELLLARWPAGNPKPTIDSLVNSRQSAPVFDGTTHILSGPPVSSRASLHPLLTSATSGVHADLWTDTEAVLCFSNETCGATLRLSMFAPGKAGETEKFVTITPNFAEPVVTAIRRGEKPAEISLDLPGGIEATPELRLQVDLAEPAVLGDIRRLGVKICAISIDRHARDAKPE